MSPVERQLVQLLAPTVAAMGYELLGIEYLAQGKHSKLRVFIDAEDGIGLEDCEAVSHQVSGILDVEDPIRGQFNLEVSSPGLDRPLFELSHYERFVGAKAKLKLNRALAGQRNYIGLIKEVHDTNIYIETEDGHQVELAFMDIQKANLVPEF